MDVFRFHNPNVPTKMEQGEIINGLKTKLWVERYIKEGEFKFVANASSGIKENLPIGSFVSHINTPEVMIVENHEISDDQDKEPEIIITGRSFETELENRVVGSNKTFPADSTLPAHEMVAAYSWDQIVILINHYLNTSTLLDDDNALMYVTALAQITGTGVSVERSLKNGSLYEHVLALLSIDGLGIETVRPNNIWNPWAPFLTGVPDVGIVIHKGVDRSKEVKFSYDTGEIVSADYLWSNKRSKNAALVSGKWVETVVVPTASGYDRKMILVDASDIDQKFDTPPTGDDLTETISKMHQRGLDILKAQRDVAITKAEVSKEAPKSIYRRDFDVGDLVTVLGDYNEVTKMRISEFVEIEDDLGESGYPTLSIEEV